MLKKKWICLIVAALLLSVGVLWAVDTVTHGTMTITRQEHGSLVKTSAVFTAVPGYAFSAHIEDIYGLIWRVTARNTADPNFGTFTVKDPDGWDLLRGRGTGLTSATVLCTIDSSATLPTANMGGLDVAMTSASLTRAGTITIYSQRLK